MLKVDSLSYVQTRLMQLLKLKNDGGTTTLVNSNVQTFAEGNSWAVALSADNTNNALKVQVTGEASHNIRWVANIQTSEVTYA